VRQSWVRPYSPGRGRWLVIAWEAAALAFLTWTTIRLFDLTGPGVRVLSAILTVVWLAGSVRILRMGVYVAPERLLIRGLLHSRILCWRDVAQVRLHRATHKIGRWEVESGMTVLIEGRDGVTVNTELWAQGIDFHARPTEFHALYQDLRNRHLAARSA
jgi:hypothetical protein